MPAQGLGVTGNLIELLGGDRVLEVQIVVPGSLASQVGIARGDRILSINGLAPGNAAVNQLAIARGGGRLEIMVQRNGAPLTLRNNQFGGGFGTPGYGAPGYGAPGYRIPGYGTPGYGRPGSSIPGSGSFPPIDAPIRLTPGGRGPNLQMNLEASVGFGGVKVTEVTRGGIGHRLQFRVGDVITTVNGTPVNSTLQFQRTYVVNNRRQIVLGVIRNGRAGTVVIDERTLGHQPHRPQPPQAPQPITTKLGLSTFQDREGKVTVAGGSEQGLAKQLGIATRGIRILEINGQPIRRPGDLNKIDDAIAAGKVTRLVITILRPGGVRETVSYPTTRRAN